MAVLIQNSNGHIQTQLTRSLERILEEANQSGELRLSNRKLKDFPKTGDKYCLRDTVHADLSKNRFSELPEEIIQFPFLERLQCYHNAIRYIPESVGSLQCLNFLDLSRNQLTSLPRELCQLPIKILLVSNNNLTCLPDELNRMIHLTELDASCNQLTHLPPRMGDLRNLQSLILRNNLLLAIPIEITFLSLVRMDLRANRIGTLPIEIRDMTSLIDLLVEDNPLTSPPASLCKRGRVHIFKYLEIEAVKLDKKTGGSNGGTLGRRPRRGNTSSPGPPLLADRLKQKRQNVDSGYSTSSDGYDKRWSQEIIGDVDKHWTSSPVPSRSNEMMNGSSNNNNTIQSTVNNLELTKSARLSPCVDLVNNSNENDEKPNNKPLHQIQTYREYKEALKQQRAHDIQSIYRTKDNDEQQNTKTEPNTPTHQPKINHNSLATSKSDPTPLNSVLNNTKQHYVDIKKETTHYSPIHISNGIIDNDKNNCNNTYIKNYVKPRSPIKINNSDICNNDNNIVVINKVKQGSPRLTNGTTFFNCGSNGIKNNNKISWNKDEKMSFTMRREIDKAREETDLINQLRNIIETKLKMTLPEELAPALTDGVVLCHLANHIKPRSVASIYVPSPAVPKLSMARCRRNVENFIDACRRIGVDEGRLCSTLDVIEALKGRGLPRLVDTVEALCELIVKEKVQPPPKIAMSTFEKTTVSLLLLTIFFGTIAFFIAFPPPN